MEMRKRLYGMIMEKIVNPLRANKIRLIKCGAYIVLFINYLIVMNIAMYSCASRIYLFGVVFIPAVLFGLFLIFIFINRYILGKVIRRNVLIFLNWLLLLTVIYCLYQGFVTLHLRYKFMEYM